MNPNEPPIRPPPAVAQLQNVGLADRQIRLLAAAAIAAIAVLLASGPVKLAMLVATGILAVTGITRNCPVYRLLGVSTNPVNRWMV